MFPEVLTLNNIKQLITCLRVPNWQLINVHCKVNVIVTLSLKVVCYERHIFVYGTMIWVLSRRTNTILSADSKRSRMNNSTWQTAILKAAGASLNILMPSTINARRKTIRAHLNVRTQEVLTAVLLRLQVCDNVWGPLLPDCPKKGTAFICQGPQLQKEFFIPVFVAFLHIQSQSKRPIIFFCISCSRSTHTHTLISAQTRRCYSFNLNLI